MRKQDTLDLLTAFNEWRRGGEGDQPDPKEIGLAIDSAIDFIQSIETRKNRGCWDISAFNCDCPACGGFND